MACGLLICREAAIAALIGQAFAGRADYNDRQLADAGRETSQLRYVTSSDFAVDVAENWQSEYLQFFLYAFAIVRLVQCGSPSPSWSARGPTVLRTPVTPAGEATRDAGAQGC